MVAQPLLPRPSSYLPNYHVMTLDKVAPMAPRPSPLLRRPFHRHRHTPAYTHTHHHRPVDDTSGSTRSDATKTQRMAAVTLKLTPLRAGAWKQRHRPLSQAAS